MNISHRITYTNNVSCTKNSTEIEVLYMGSFEIGNNTKKQRRRAMIVIALFSFVIAVPWHQAYDWLGQPQWLGLLLPRNESVWEHLKLAFYPVVLCMYWPCTMYQQGQDKSQRLVNGGIASALPIVVVVFGFYGIHDGLGIEQKVWSTILDIGLLFVGNLIGCIHSFWPRKQKESPILLWIVMIYYIVVLFLFVVTMYKTPNIPLFTISNA